MESVTQAELRLSGRAAADAEGRFRFAANQLRAVLARYFPAVLELSSGADERWLWRLLARSNTPRLAAKLTRRTLEVVLRSCGVRRIDATRLHEVLGAPHLRAGEGVERACADEVGRLIELLEVLFVQRARAEKRRNEALEKVAESQRASSPVSDVDLTASMPGAGSMVVATLFGEAAPALRERDLAALRAVAGVAPITKRSGKSTQVSMRRARNTLLANALFHASRVAAMTDPRFKALYSAIRARGKSYGRALRGVADRYLDVLFAVLRTGKPYDEARGPSKPVLA
jgi:transposase